MGWAERVRVASHLERAERAARGRPPAGLDPAARWARALVLDLLSRYRGAGCFPSTAGGAAPRPTFVDPGGARCAVAHLLEASGQGALVARIARERNHARVVELANEPLLGAWLRAAGLTVAEAAAIQPSYCVSSAGCLCEVVLGWPRPADGVLEGTYTGHGRMRVEVIHGDGLGNAVGDEVLVSVGPSSGNVVRYLLPVSREHPAPSAGPDAGAPPFGGALGVLADDTVECDTLGAPVPSVPRDGVVAALMVADCRGAIGALDARYRRDSCATEDGGCAVAARAELVPADLLLALVPAVLWAARRRP